MRSRRSFALIGAVLALAQGRSASADLTLPRLSGSPSMPGSPQSALLVAYYATLIEDEDLEAFQANVRARYTDGTLERLVASTDPDARRAAVVALGLMGGYRSNAAVAAALKDDDATIRELAVRSLWAIWFRADTPENNAALEHVAALISRGRDEQAEELATRLILRAPGFAEAYNQRAIARFSMGRLADSALDCERALEHNPYHVGALGGLGQCYLRLGRFDRALETFRRALALQPHDLSLRQAVAALESGQP